MQFSVRRLHTFADATALLMLIAAIALSLGNTIVVSSDSDLSAVAGLTVENWSV